MAKRCTRVRASSGTAEQLCGKLDYSSIVVFIVAQGSSSHVPLHLVTCAFDRAELSVMPCRSLV